MTYRTKRLTLLLLLIAAIAQGESLVGDSLAGESLVGDSLSGSEPSQEGGGGPAPPPSISYNFDATGPTYINMSGGGWNAICSSDCPTWGAATGRNGTGGVTFEADGLNDELDVVGSIVFTTNDEATISFHVKSVVDNSWGEDNASIFRGGENNVHLRASVGGLTAKARFNNVPEPITEGTEVDQTYHHVAVVYHGISSAKPSTSVEWFVDGLPVGTPDIGTSREVSNTFATIGLSDGGVAEINVTLDNFCVWLVALTDAQVLEISTVDVESL